MRHTAAISFDYWKPITSSNIHRPCLGYADAGNTGRGSTGNNLLGEDYNFKYKRKRKMRKLTGSADSSTGLRELNSPRPSQAATANNTYSGSISSTSTSTAAYKKKIKVNIYISQFQIFELSCVFCFSNFQDCKLYNVQIFKFSCFF